MNIRQQLDNEFDSLKDEIAASEQSFMEAYTKMAEGYALVENVVAVLSDLNRKRSMVFHGRFSQHLDINHKECTKNIPSIWEEEIFSAIHPEDLETKLLQELLFFHHISRLPSHRRFDLCLWQRLRMHDRSGEWKEVLHRLYYIPGPDNKSPRLALCLYGAMHTPFNGNAMVVDTLTGQTESLDHSTGSRILSRQELAVLRLIDNGYRSRDIAERLYISVHTVSRHRQNIIAKLNVRNSTEACRIARNLGVL